MTADSNNMFQNSHNVSTLQTGFNNSGSDGQNLMHGQPVTLEGIVAKFSKTIEPMFIRLTNEVTSLRHEINGLRNEVKELKKEKSAVKSVMPENPYKVMDDFLEFEKKLQEENNFLNSFGKELLMVAKTPNFTKNCWRKLLVDELAEKLCWKGTEEKKSVRSLSAAKAIRNAAISIGLGEDEYVKSTKSFFQFAKNRHELRKKYKKTFDSILSHSETDSDLEPTNAQPDKLTPIITNVSCIGDAQFINLGQDSASLSRSFQQQLPSTKNIRQIPDLQNILKVDVFENKHRTRLAKGLIHFILYKQPDRKLFKEDFLQLAQSIVEIFPSEVKETYYVPYKAGHRAKGKLLDAYCNTKTRLSVAGLIRRRVKSKPEENITLENENTSGNENTEDIDESQLSILKSVCSEWDLVLETWRKTHYFRQRELKNLNLKTHEYIAKYKVLLHEKNYELFDIDFKLLYPTSKNFYEWKLYYRQIIAKADKLRDRSVRDILTYISDAEEEDSKLALSLMLIAYILPNTRQRTKLEIQECFISYCKNTIDKDDETRHRTKRIKVEGYPKIYLVGDSSQTICEAFVDLCGTRLKFSNPIKAIEVCFHYFMVMNIEYPRYSTHVWIFIQKLIYEVNTARDAVIPAIDTLINDLRLDKL